MGTMLARSRLMSGMLPEHFLHKAIAFNKLHVVKAVKYSLQ